METKDAMKRLKAFARRWREQPCKILSIGNACECPLCDIDQLQARIAELEARLAAIEGGGVIPEADEDAQWVWSLAHQLSRSAIARLEGEESLSRLLRIYRKLTPPAAEDRSRLAASERTRVAES